MRIPGRPAAFGLALFAFVWLSAAYETGGEELDVYRPAVRGNGMLVVDRSASMGRPVYQHAVDYGRLTAPPAADTGDLPVDSRFTPLDPDGIYLVSLYLPYRGVDYDDGTDRRHTVAFVGDILASAGTTAGGITPPDSWFQTIVPVLNIAGELWTVARPQSIDRDAAGRLIFPGDRLTDRTGTRVAVPPALAGQRLPNHQDIRVAAAIGPDDTARDTRSFMDVMTSVGVYFSGVFEAPAPGPQFTGDPSQAEQAADGHCVYVFATGNWIAFYRLAATAGRPGDDPMTVGQSKALQHTRLRQVLGAVKALVAATRHRINWGLTVTGTGGVSGEVLAPLGSGVDEVLRYIDGLAIAGEDNGSLGAAVQDAYTANHRYLDSHPEDVDCAANFLVVATDGYVEGDGDWGRIVDRDALEFPRPVFDGGGNGRAGGDGMSYGDADTWPAGYHLDDLAHWLAHQAGRPHTLFVVAAQPGNPYLQDAAASGGGSVVAAQDPLDPAPLAAAMAQAWSGPSIAGAPVSPTDRFDRSQNGDAVFITFFKPESAGPWPGNLKKYHLSLLARPECDRNRPAWTVVDGNGVPALACDGRFRETARSCWSPDQAPDGGRADAGGAGAVLLNQLDAAVPASPYDARNIYTCIDPGNSTALVRVRPDTLSPADLAVATAHDRDAVIDLLYGVSPGYESSTGTPANRREWALGDIVHSEPCIIDYKDEAGGLVHRFVAVAANDGMLHVFVDDVDPVESADTVVGGRYYAPGAEIGAFVPASILRQRAAEDGSAGHRYRLDGTAVLHQTPPVDAAGNATAGGVKKTLIVGQRRGGRNYWALDATAPDPGQWRLKWRVQGGQGEFAELGQTWSTPVVAGIGTARGVRRGVVIFGGGYDPREDDFPEPWDDSNGNGIFDPAGESYTDTNGNGRHDAANPDKNRVGRAVYVLDLETGAPLFSARYGPTTTSATGTVAHADMRWCFPAAPTVVDLPQGLHIYITDVYANVWKVTGRMDAEAEWSLTRIFRSNPGSDQQDARTAAQGIVPYPDPSDGARKAFASPDVSFFGNEWTDAPVLYFGTGDRVHPRTQPVTANRFYAITDTGALADETDLLNLTCNELAVSANADRESDANAGDGAVRAVLTDILYGKRAYPDPSSDGRCRGWYRVLGKQGDCDAAAGDHRGEMVAGRSLLYAGTVFLTTFQAGQAAGCEPADIARTYALDYSTGALLTTAPGLPARSGDSQGVAAGDGWTGLTATRCRGLPSAVRIIGHRGDVIGLFGAGGKIVGALPPAARLDAAYGLPGGVIPLLWETY